MWHCFMAGFIFIWFIGGLIIFRESRVHNNLVRLMAIISIALGPLGMMLYLGIRYLGQSIQVSGLLTERGPYHKLPADK
jgi:tellurite resistance protein TehA-like permease